jgi:tRNA(Arg) A34 adenosine deaminase TadA
MCAGAIVNAGIRHLVIATAAVPGIEAPGLYSVENQLELLGLADSIVVTRGVLQQEATEYYAGVAV